jgi:hypothetical protein
MQQNASEQDYDFVPNRWRQSSIGTTGNWRLGRRRVEKRSADFQPASQAAGHESSEAGSAPPSFEGLKAKILISSDDGMIGERSRRCFGPHWSFF